MPALGPVGRFGLPLALLLGAANVASEYLPSLKAPLVAAGAAAWVLLLAAEVRADPGAWRRWGFRADTARAAAVPAFAVVLPLLAAMTAWGAHVGNYPPPHGFPLVVAAYPVWGIAQQFLLQAVVWTHISERLPRPLAQPLAAVLFALSHAPDWPVAALTLPVGLASIEHYRRWPNLWVLGTAHALLGTVAFYFLLGRDPLAALR